MRAHGRLGMGVAVCGWVATMLVLGPSARGATPGEVTIEGTVTVLDREGKPKSHNDGVIVFLDDVEHPPAATPPGPHAVLRQVDKAFVPSVLPIVVGTTVDFPNNDTVFHNVFSLSKTQPFDLGIYEQGGSRSVTFDQPGLVKVYCNIHPQMVGHVVVLPTPYFAVTDAAGHFVIRQAPLGRATVRTWYPASRSWPEQTVAVTPQGVHDLQLRLLENVHLELREETITLEHKNKWGQAYPAKY